MHVDRMELPDFEASLEHQISSKNIIMETQGQVDEATNRTPYLIWVILVREEEEEEEVRESENEEVVEMEREREE